MSPSRTAATAAQPLFGIALASVPVGIVYALSWFGVFTFVNAYLKHELNYTSQHWTAVTLWYTGSMVAWPFVCNELSSWLGRRWTVTLVFTLAGALFYGFSIFHQRWVISLMLSLMAMAAAVVSSVFMPMVAEAGGDRPGRALAAFNFVNTLIGCSALLGGGYLTTRLGYVQAFTILALGCWGSAALFFFATRRFRPAHPAQTVSIRNLSRPDIRSLLTGPYLVVVLCGISMEAFNYHTVNQLWPNLAREQFHLPETAINTVVAVGRLPALLSLLLLGHFVDRLNVIRGYGISFLFVAVCVFTIGTVSSGAAVPIAYGAYFLGMGCVWSTNGPAVNASVPARLRDAAFALMMVPSLLAVFLVGVIHNRLLATGLSLAGVFRWCGVIAGGAGGLVLLLYSFSRHARRRHPAPAPAVVTTIADPLL